MALGGFLVREVEVRFIITAVAIRTTVTMMIGPASQIEYMCVEVVVVVTGNVSRAV